jgi:hypothetical protein
MNVDTKTTEGLTPSRVIEELRFFKAEKEAGKANVLGHFGFSDVFEMRWQEEPFKVSLVQADRTLGGVIDLPHLWIEKAIAGARMGPDEEEKVVKGKFVCVFSKELSADPLKLIFIAPYTEEVGLLLDNKSLSETRSLETVSTLGSIKSNAWF